MSRRNDLLNKIRATLESVLPGKVYRTRMISFDAAALPVVVILPRTEFTSRFVMGQRQVQLTVDAEVHGIGEYGRPGISDPVSADEAIDDLCVAVNDAMLADMQMGGLADTTEPVDTRFEFDLGDTGPRVMITQSFRLTYRIEHTQI
jgi:hypothetical protein